MRLALVSAKGGTGKTTGSAYLSTALYQSGTGEVLALDCDPQGSLRAWSPGLPFPVAVPSPLLPATGLRGRITAIADGTDHVVLDSPPGNADIINAVILSAPLVIVPVSATGLDIDRLGPTWDLLAVLEDIHPMGLAVGVLLTKVRAGTRSRVEARAVLSERYPVLLTEIDLREHYADSFGKAPSDLGAYADLLAELTS
jgi:chromosome partitioning protein